MELEKSGVVIVSLERYVRLSESALYVSERPVEDVNRRKNEPRRDQLLRGCVWIPADQPCGV